jgi:hypothetical protein
MWKIAGAHCFEWLAGQGVVFPKQEAHQKNYDDQMLHL